MDKEKFINNFKESVLKRMEQEVLDELNVPYSTWCSLKNAYAMVRSEIVPIDEKLYRDILEHMYIVRKAVDTMKF